MSCRFMTIENIFTFGRYKGLSMADVLDINPSYIIWCNQYCTNGEFIMFDKVINQIKVVYPEFYMDDIFEENRLASIKRFV